ncbi:MAG: hypothetical protein MZV63_46935 [Marinilabiliales bacterium]|nr:hypothetical protein [Marinilabiliales bacterium]
MTPRTRPQIYFGYEEVCKHESKNVFNLGDDGAPARLLFFRTGESGSLGPGAAPAVSSASYDDLVALFREWRKFVKPRIVDGVPDYSAAAMSAHFAGLEQWRGRLRAIDPSGWTRSRRVDYEILRAEMNGFEFDSPHPEALVTRSRILHRRPGLPSRRPITGRPGTSGDAPPVRIRLPPRRKRGARLPVQAPGHSRHPDQAKANLVEDAKDLFYLGIRVKKEESAVLENLVRTIARHHPTLVPDAEKAKAAVDDFRGWLEEKHKNHDPAFGYRDRKLQLVHEERPSRSLYLG